MAKHTALAIVKHVRRYKRLCYDICYQYDKYIRMTCLDICIRFIHRCDPRLGDGYVQCIENAKKRVIDLIERIKDRLTV